MEAVESLLQGPGGRRTCNAAAALERLAVLPSGLIFNSRRQRKAICSGAAIYIFATLWRCLDRRSFEVQNGGF